MAVSDDDDKQKYFEYKFIKISYHIHSTPLKHPFLRSLLVSLSSHGDNNILFCMLLFHRYEGKRMEIETWLTRMENRCERMGVVATTADVLEAQQKEQKVSVF